jgi:uncharacterized paraquat-inducible protein A
MNHFLNLWIPALLTVSLVYFAFGIYWVKYFTDKEKSVFPGAEPWTKIELIKLGVKWPFAFKNWVMINYYLVRVKIHVEKNPEYQGKRTDWGFVAMIALVFGLNLLD